MPPLSLLIITLLVLVQSLPISEKDKNNESPKKEVPKKLTDVQTWSYCFLFVTIINVMAANGAFLYKFLKFRWFKILILALMAFSVGVLLANSIVNLIPIGFDLVPHDLPELSNRTWIWKSCTILFGVLSLAMVETLIKVAVLYRETKNGIMSSFQLHHNHGSPQQVEPILDSPKERILTVDSSEVIDLKEENTNNKATTTGSGPFYSLVCFRPSTPSFAMLIIFGDAIHNFIDGLAMGSTFIVSFEQGLNMFISILSEELPHELGDFAALLAAGFTVKQALFWNIISSLSCYLGMILGLILGPLKSAAPYIEVYCGGVFIYISVVALYPEVMEEAEKISNGVFRSYLKNLVLVYVSIILGMAFIVGLANVTIHVPM